MGELFYVTEVNVHTFFFTHWVVKNTVQIYDFFSLLPKGLIL